jgi:hypothetical protein
MTTAGADTAPAFAYTTAYIVRPASNGVVSSGGPDGPPLLFWTPVRRLRGGRIKSEPFARKDC